LESFSSLLRKGEADVVIFPTNQGVLSLELQKRGGEESGLLSNTEKKLRDTNLMSEPKRKYPITKGQDW